jgi:hypothetical protein
MGRLGETCIANLAALIGGRSQSRSAGEVLGLLREGRFSFSTCGAPIHERESG